MRRNLTDEPEEAERVEIEGSWKADRDGAESGDIVGLHHWSDRVNRALVNCALRRGRLSLVVFLVAASVTFGSSSLARAEEDRWSFRVALGYVDAQGHDPHVLSVDGPANGSGAFRLETESDIGRYLGARYRRGQKWAWGADFSWFTGGQELSTRTLAAAADGAPVALEITDRVLVSTSPEEVLFFRRLGDTDMNAWTFDVYALRRLSRGPRGGFQLLVGVRNADFDNDNRFAAGIEDALGTRIDASSNYDRMIGPLVGLVLDREWGRSRFELILTQSVVQGDAELFAMRSDFIGPFVDGSEEIVARRDFRQPKSVTIPITDLHLRWSYPATEHLSYGLGLGISRWSDVSVPPGVRPTGGLDTLYESTIDFYGLQIAVAFGL